MNERALIILSNIAEMKLDNAELLRILGNKLLQLGYNNYAIEIFEQVVKLSGENPQPYRDLALAYQADGQYQKALDTFYKIMLGGWDGRFRRLKQIIFVEMNDIISRRKVDVSKINKEFIFKIPVDIRITLGWSSDSTDIDLHVKDPYCEMAYYGHQLTRIGGRMSDDITQGFGPEEFMLKKAVEGEYKIKTNNFSDSRQSVSGPVTLYLDIFTFYGTDKETRQRVLVRTENVKEDNVIGSITFGAVAKNAAAAIDYCDKEYAGEAEVNHPVPVFSGGYDY
jgi:tetratricopeptide (TPR) repeat protein